jgi:hypothetical protein
MDPPNGGIPWFEPTVDRAASPYFTSKKSNAIPLSLR